ncbi:hypothetical protein JCM10212_004950 [Sporobolomyces blumeae]
MPPTSQALRSAFLSVAQQWPKDVLRPSLQFSEAIRTAADRVFLPANATPPPRGSDSSGPLNELSPVQAKKAEESIAALHRLMENRALKAHPITDRTTKPASVPKHYARIEDTVERAARGEVFKKSWLPKFKWK